MTGLRRYLSVDLETLTGKLVALILISYAVISVVGGVLLAFRGEFLKAFFSLLVPSYTDALAHFHTFIFPVMLVARDFVAPYPLFFGLVVANFPAVWELVTSIFVHANIIHLGFNVIALHVLGSRFEGMLGSRRMLYTFFMGGVLANLATVAFALDSRALFTASVGASGALFAIAGAIALIEYRVYRSVQSLWWIFLIFIVSSASIAGPVNVLAHAVGLAYGALAGIYYGERIRRWVRIRGYQWY